jgi:hypothetical protein
MKRRRPARRGAGLRAWLVASAAALHGVCSAQDAAPSPLPSFAQLEAEGTRIGEIHVVVG